MTKPEQGPEPASPLPWYPEKCDSLGRDQKTMRIVAESTRRRFRAMGTSARPTQVATVYDPDDAIYINHACNNYPAAQARIAELEAAEAKGRWCLVLERDGDEELVEAWLDGHVSQSLKESADTLIALKCASLDRICAIDQTDCSAAMSALDEINKLCGRDDWEYAGQIVRDVRALRARLEQLEAIIEEWRCAGLLPKDATPKRTSEHIRLVAKSYQEDRTQFTDLRADYDRKCRIADEAQANADKWRERYEAHCKEDDARAERLTEERDGRAWEELRRAALDVEEHGEVMIGALRSALTALPDLRDNRKASP